MAYKKIEIPLYKSEIMAFDSFKSLEQYRKKNNMEVSDGWYDALDGGAAGMAGHLVIAGTDEAEMFLALEPSYAVSLEDFLGNLMHESIHISWFILSYVGVGIAVDNHEAQTYLAQHIFGEYLTKFKVLEKTFENVE